MYCRNCGMPVPDNAVVCPNCGASSAPSAPVVDKNQPSLGIAVLCFFFPLVGLILYLVWKDTEPGKAKSAGKGALIGVIVGVALVIIIFIITFALIGSMAGSFWEYFVFSR